jgi:multiple sugar transport system permease protein
MSSSVVVGSKTGKARMGTGLTHLILIVGSLIMVFPFIWQILMSLSTNAQVTSVPPTVWPGTLHWENFAHVFDQLPFLNQLWVSVAVTVIRTVGQLLLCSMAGYAFARMSFPFKRTIFALVLAILMVPPQVYLLPQYQIVQGLGWLNTIAGIAAPGIFSAFGTFLMRQFFLGLPVELEEAALLDGCGPWRTFRSVVLPLARPALATLAIFTLLSSWNDLLWPLVAISDDTKFTLQVGLASFQGTKRTEWSQLMAGNVITTMPLIIAFLVAQRRFIATMSFSGLKG